MARLGENVFSTCETHEFFKVYLPNHSSQQLWRSFLQRVSSTVIFAKNPKASLKDQTGRIWNVDLEKGDDEHGVVFTKGWKGFASHQSLELGDFLLFSYAGSWRFNVKIFGKNGCPKKKKSVNGAEASDVPEKEEQDDLEQHELRCENTGTYPADRQRSKMAGAKKSEKSGIAREPVFVKPTNPHFVKNITRWSKYHTSVPLTFLTSYGIKLKKEVNLWDHNGKKWAVKVRFVDRGHADLTTGWSRFCRHHKLVNNKCVFEFLTDQKSSTCDDVRVQIIRDAEIPTSTIHRCKVID